MTSIVCVGAQWGDEGKGKVVDTLAERARMVVRYNGGNNAGHSLNIDGETIVLHIIPTGAMWEHTINVIGAGVLVDPLVLAAEIELLQSKGKLKDKRCLIISPFCHVILPEHRERDSNQESTRTNPLGTTKRGVGPCYEDKVSRKGIRIADFISEDWTISGGMAAELLNARDIIAPFVRDAAKQIAHFCKDPNELVLFEGAQGTMLDIGYGTYPFVTSSHTVAAYAPVGAGISHRLVGEAVGISKAYVTRVGTGPFPTQMMDKIDQLVREKGSEFGATTGRPRKCGWLDLVALKRAVKIDQMRFLALTKLDVLSGIDTIKACTTYILDGQTMDRMPHTAEEWERVEPGYVYFDGWDTIDENAFSFSDLPTGAQEFITFIENYLGVQICLVGIGPGRGEEVVLHDIVEEYNGAK